jgi:hypothetical protein
LWFAIQNIPVRAVRTAAVAAGGKPSKLRYRKLNPNYGKYWMPDSDAVASIDRREAMLWFRSRGDECLNCTPPLKEWLSPGEELILRIRK